MFLRFCANLSFLFTEYSALIERYEAAYRIGFKGVESAYPKESEIMDVINVIHTLKLKQVLVNIAVDNDFKFGCAAIPGHEEIFLNNLLKTIKFAKQVGCDKIHIMAGLRIEGISYDLQRLSYEANLMHAAKILEAENMIGLIEPINNYSVPYYFLNDYDTALKIIKQINKSSLRLQLDVFHLQLIAGDLTNNIAKLLPYIGHVQIAQVPDRNEPSSPGEINFDYLFSLFIRFSYNKWIGLEYIPKYDTKRSLSWINFKKMSEMNNFN